MRTLRKFTSMYKVERIKRSLTHTIMNVDLTIQTILMVRSKQTVMVRSTS